MKTAIVLLIAVLGGVFISATCPSSRKDWVWSLRCPVCDGVYKHLNNDSDDWLWLKVDGIDPRILECDNGHEWREDTGEQVRITYP